MDRAARLVVVGLLAGSLVATLACGLVPRPRATAEMEATAVGGGLLGPEETATARARGASQEGDIERAIATPTATPHARDEATPTASGDGREAEGWNEALPSGQALLPSLPLSQGIEDWDLWLQPGASVPGENEVFAAPDVKYGSVVVFVRSCSCNDGGAAGIMQVPEVSVAGWEHLYVWLVGRVDDERGGNIANSDPRWFPEGAVQVRLKYVSATGEQAEWYHGFYMGSAPGADREHFTRVEGGQWFSYLSEDLSDLSPHPATINEVRLYGFGWEFTGAVAEVSLVGSDEPAR